jgi:3-hydroxyisobutyrate dehydrogenase-like beta-hydroxyacid dehydrogenase
MISTIAVIAPGAMGSAVARRLADRGATVLTSLAGRSEETRHRAAAAGMIDADDEALVRSDVILSILPPNDALALAERFVAPLTRAARKPIYADCNAIDVETAHRIAATLAPTGAPFVDGGIIGPPPGPKADPTFYFSGEAARLLAPLADLGLTVRVMDAPIGAASALKMSFAGINKGMTLLAAAMVLGATRAGAADALRTELADHHPVILERIVRGVPDMFPKAYRWAPEMEEIAAFLGEDAAARQIFEGMAALCRRLAADRAGHGAEIATLQTFVDRACGAK